MAIIPQPHLFGWEDMQGLGDLERLQCVLEAIPDEPLMAMLEHDRGRGRNTYPVRAMWNATLAGIVFQHPSVETLRRELARNGQLRALCGFAGLPPSAWAFSRFFHRLLTADRGYDGTAFLTACWDDYHIKPIIDIRNMWKDGEDTRLLPGQTNVTYDYRGTVYCHDPVGDATRTMRNGGFEKDRQTLKKRCPAGTACAGHAQCPVASGLRIPLSTDRRVFTPVDRASYQWEREYKHRTAVERVNSRLDVSFGFELHTIRGFKKMQMRSGLALIVMVAMAVGRIRQQHPERMRSLVRSA